MEDEENHSDAALVDSQPTPGWEPLILWREHQVIIAGCIGLSLLAIAGFYWSFESPVDIDKVGPLRYEYQVDLNQCPWQELAAIPGIGPTLAQRIVEFRQTRGRIGSIQELLEVRGIGSKTLRRMEPFLLPIKDAEAPTRQPDKTQIDGA